jgi:epoxyqueuosine reductase
MSLSDAIRHEARALGFDAVGISRVGLAVPFLESNQSPDSLSARLLEWLRRGYHGVMTWMERNPPRRADPGLVLHGCRSIISVGMNYYTSFRADERPGHGRIARYAWGNDYHRVMRDRLEQLEHRIKVLAPDARTRSYVDTGPVMEKAWAQEAGLGWIGKHSNLVSTQFGSWLLLGEVLTTLDLDPDEPATDLCGSCTLCIKACPTGAIVEPYIVDARRCVSYLTIELRGTADPIPDELATRMGNRIFGCDDCLDVCPYNVHAQPTAEPAFQPSPLTLASSFKRLGSLDERSFVTTFQHSPIRRSTHTGLRRNITIAQQNETRHPAAHSVTGP